MKNIFLIFLSVFFISCNKDLYNHYLYKHLIRENPSNKNEFLDSYYIEALEQQYFGNYKNALLMYINIFDIDRNNDAACFQLSNIFLIMNNKDKSIYYASKAYELVPENKWYNLNLAKILITLNDKESALKVLKKLTVDYPDNIEYQFNLASLYEDLGKNNDALLLYDNIEYKIGINEDIIIKKYKIYITDNKFEKAELELLKLIDQFPDELRYYYILSDFYRSMHDDKKALNIFNQILKIDKFDKNALLGKVDLLLENKNYNKSIYILDTLFFDSPININDKISILFDLIGDKNVFKPLKNNLSIWMDSLFIAYPDENKLLLINAEFFYEDNKVNESCNELKKYLNKDKKNIIAWERIISINYFNKNYKEVIDLCDSALNYFPKKASLYLYKSYCYYDLENYAFVVDLLENSKNNFEIENNEERSQIFSLLAECYYKLNNFKKSDKYFLNVLEFDPKNNIVLNNFSFYLSLRNENLKKAKEMSRITIESETENPIYLDTYAWILYKMKNYKEAKIYIEKAIKNGGLNNFEVVDHYADISFVTEIMIQRLKIGI